MNYLRQKASLWVTVSVLAGGLASAIILSFLVRIENDLQKNPYYEQVLAEGI